MIPTLEEQIHIEEILAEARAYGLDWEVKQWAETFMKEDPELKHVDAYQLAYLEWIK